MTAYQHLCLCPFFLLLSACTVAGGKDSDSATDSSLPAADDDARGGRLYDKWYGESTWVGEFTPDSKSTAGLADGVGGPFNDGTLPDAAGTAVLNDSGHDYRLKNLFGWDLRGAEGIYGAGYQAKSYVRPQNLIGGALDDQALEALFRDGQSGAPGLGTVLDTTDLADVVAFVSGVRDGDLARPDQIFRLDAEASGKYALIEGADPARGKAELDAVCAGCHGADGQSILFDDGAYSLGSHARAKAYEDWFKVLNGHPGSDMGRMVPAGLTGAEQSAYILDILAALCDRSSFPPPEGQGDVAEGDRGCGSYLR